MITAWSKLLLALSCSIGLAACTGGEEELPPPPVRPVKIFAVEGDPGSAKRSFPGTITASQRAELSFRVGGVLQEILVKEGERVKNGQVLARLDPTDFELRVEDRQASFDNAEKNYNRGKVLVAEGNISKLDFDRLEANFRSTKAALDLARKELDYTQLRAPFVGNIGRREVDNFEEVAANQAIFQLENLEQLDVAVDLPEILIRSLRSAQTRGSAGESEVAEAVEAFASFEGRENERFSLQIKEVATRADTQTQTFRVTFSMPQPENFNLLPGMTANVAIDLSRVMQADSSRWVPATAVVANSGLESRVWVLDGDSMTVSARPVTIGRMSGRSIEVISGLDGGEEIVSVGAAYLAEGMEVSRMPLGEQAEPRADDPV